MAHHGNLFIVSGPSGAGKSVLAACLLKQVAGLRFSISYTTRPPRGSEKNGVEYYFVDRAQFEALRRSGELLEWAEVYGNCYGTSRRLVDEILSEGDDVLLDVDVQGAQIIRQGRSEAIGIFIMPPSFQVLRQRLESRRLDKDYVIEQRLQIAFNEIKQYKNYDFLIINEELGKSIEELRSIVVSSRCRMSRRAEPARSIVATFGGLDAEDP
jgi:guanylate kinase